MNREGAHDAKEEKSEKEEDVVLTWRWRIRGLIIKNPVAWPVRKSSD
ncbi:MAG: hypothetical protein WBL95_06705 [Microcoleus sp.]